MRIDSPLSVTPPAVCRALGPFRPLHVAWLVVADHLRLGGALAVFGDEALQDLEYSNVQIVLNWFCFVDSITLFT